MGLGVDGEESADGGVAEEGSGGFDPGVEAGKVGRLGEIGAKKELVLEGDIKVGGLDALELGKDVGGLFEPGPLKEAAKGHDGIAGMPVDEPAEMLAGFGRKVFGLEFAEDAARRWFGLEDGEELGANVFAVAEGVGFELANEFRDLVLEFLRKGLIGAEGVGDFVGLEVRDPGSAEGGVEGEVGEALVLLL